MQTKPFFNSNLCIFTQWTNIFMYNHSSFRLSCVLYLFSFFHQPILTKHFVKPNIIWRNPHLSLEPLKSQIYRMIIQPNLNSQNLNYTFTLVPRADRVIPIHTPVYIWIAEVKGEWPYTRCVKAPLVAIWSTRVNHLFPLPVAQLRSRQSMIGCAVAQSLGR